LGAEGVGALVDPFWLYLSSNLTEILGQFLWQWGTQSTDLRVILQMKR